MERAARERDEMAQEEERLAELRAPRREEPAEKKPGLSFLGNGPQAFSAVGWFISTAIGMRGSR